MKLDLPAALAEAAGHARRNRDVVVAVGGLFFFLPNLALGLLLPAAEPPAGGDGASGEAVVAALSAYIAGNWHWLAVQSLAELFGTAILLALFLAPGRPTVGEAMRLVGGRLPVLVAAELLLSIAKAVGLMFFVLPGLWVIGRSFVVLPALVAEPRRRFGDALAHAAMLTAGHALPLVALAAVLFLAAQTAVLLLSATAGIVSSGGVNPVTAGMLAAAVALVGAAMSTAFALVRAVVYRRLASRG